MIFGLNVKKKVGPTQGTGGRALVKTVQMEGPAAVEAMG